MFRLDPCEHQETERRIADLWPQDQCCFICRSFIWRFSLFNNCRLSICSFIWLIMFTRNQFTLHQNWEEGDQQAILSPSSPTWRLIFHSVFWDICIFQASSNKIYFCFMYLQWIWEQIILIWSNVYFISAFLILSSIFIPPFPCRSILSRVTRVTVKNGGRPTRHGRLPAAGFS